MFSLPTPGATVGQITIGPDSNLWFIETLRQIARVTPAGQITEIPLSSPIGAYNAFTTGPDGNFWATACDAQNVSGCGVSFIIKIMPSGQVAYSYQLPDPLSDPVGITKGPDGNLWFTDCIIIGAETCLDNEIGRLTITGKISEFGLPIFNTGFNSPHVDYGFPAGIATGSDGNLWFADGPKIGRITPAGHLTMFSLPLNHRASPYDGIAKDSAGAIWFTEEPVVGQASRQAIVGRITTSGQITEFTLPVADSVPYAITAGPNHTIWITLCVGSSGTGCASTQIVRLTPGT